MNARIPAASHDSDRAFLRQLKLANRAQLAAMLVVFQRLVPEGSTDENPWFWKRAAVERKLGISRHAFAWFEAG